MSQYSSFQACERVRHLGCVSAQAVASRYDQFIFILIVFGVNYEAHEGCFLLQGRARKMAML